jgi:AcrR family transcriptional regulator
MPNHLVPSGKRTADECAARQEEILTQAARLFAERGYAKTDTTLLAETVGVGKGTVYRYFSSKRELFLAAADRVMRMLKQRVDARMAEIADPLESIVLGVREFLNFFNEHPGFVELLIQERALFKDRKQSTFIEHRAMNIDRWRAFYGDLIVQGRVRDIPVDRITDSLGNILYGTIFTNYFSGSSKSVEKQANDIIDVVFYGILSPQELKKRNRLAAETATDTPEQSKLNGAN